MRLRRLAAALVVVVISGLFLSAPARTRKLTEQQQRVIFEALRSYQIEASRRLLMAMELVASRLIAFRRIHGHFPRDIDEFQLAKKSLSAVIPPNPFLITPAGEPDRQTPVTVEIKFDYGLSEKQMRAAADAAPESWQADPGTITIVSSGQDLALIWGAGSDRRALRRQDGKSQIIALKAVD